jgi:hypothetical protein
MFIVVCCVALRVRQLLRHISEASQSQKEGDCVLAESKTVRLHDLVAFYFALQFIAIRGSVCIRHSNLCFSR